MRLLTLLLCASLVQPAGAQSTLTTDFETWWGLMTSAQVTHRLSVWNDAHFVNDLFIIYRTGVTYHPAHDNLVTTAGYSYLQLSAPFSNGQLVRPEHRPWMQTIYRLPSTRRVSSSFRFRYDARFVRKLKSGELDEGYSFNHRWRLNNSLRYAWGKKSDSPLRFYTTLLNESLITTGPGPQGAPFEHRTHILAQVGKGRVIYSTGYIIRYIQVNETAARLNHGPVFWLTVNLNLQKEKKQPTFIEYPGDHSH